MELLHWKEQRSVRRLIIRLSFFSSVELLLTSAITWYHYKPAVLEERENSGRNDIPVLSVSGNFITAWKKGLVSLKLLVASIAWLSYKAQTEMLILCGCSQAEQAEVPPGCSSLSCKEFKSRALDEGSKITKTAFQRRMMHRSSVWVKWGYWRETGKQRKSLEKNFVKQRAKLSLSDLLPKVCCQRLPWLLKLEHIISRSLLRSEKAEREELKCSSASLS